MNSVNGVNGVVCGSAATSECPSSQVQLCDCCLLVEADGAHQLFAHDVRVHVGGRAAVFKVAMAIVGNLGRQHPRRVIVRHCEVHH